MSLCHLCKQVTRPKEIASDDSLEKNLKKSPSCIIHWKTDSLSDSLSHLHCKQQKAVLRTAEIFAVYFGHQTRSCWNKKEKISTKTRWRPSFWNWKMKGKKSLVTSTVIWRPGNGNHEKPRKKTSLHHPKSFSSSAEQQLFWLQHLWRESKICSKLFLDQKSNRHHYYPALKPPPRLPPSRKKSKHKMKNLSQTVIIIRYYFFFFSSFTFFFLKSSPLFFLLY